MPRLLPTAAIPGVDDAIRLEDALDDETPSEFVQVFASDPRDALITVTTSTEQPYSPATDQRTDADVAGWSDAYFTASSVGFVYLFLVSPDGFVEISGQGEVTEDEVLAVAQALERRPVPEPGWDATELPDTFVPLHEGWRHSGASRSVNWYAANSLAAEIFVVAGQPRTIAFPFAGAAALTVTDIDGSPAMVVKPDYEGSPTFVTWSPEPDLVVYFGRDDGIDATLDLARGIQPVDAATWESVSRPAPPTFDGCSSFLC